jgi:hypothetical protein
VAVTKSVAITLVASGGGRGGREGGAMPLVHTIPVIMVDISICLVIMIHIILLVMSACPVLWHLLMIMVLLLMIMMLLLLMIMVLLML